MKRYYFGIDLGTTNSAITVFDSKDKSIHILKDQDKMIKGLLKSTVRFTPSGKIITGDVRKVGTISSFKTYMEENRLYEAGKFKITAVQASAEVLKYLVNVAESNNYTVDEVTITVPAKFNHTQRMNTLRAAKLAGLEKVHLINEPTSASLAYLADSEGNKNVLVYDLGGGTFDISLVQIRTKIPELNLPQFKLYKEEQNKIMVNVLDSEGDVHLGGDDIDKYMVDILKYKLGISKSSPNIDSYLLDTVILSKESESIIPVSVRGKKYDLTMEDFKPAVKFYVNQTMELIEKVVSRNPSLKIDEILLVGGSTIFTVLQKELECRLSDIKVQHSVQANMLVAIGASINSYLIDSDNSNNAEIAFTDSVSNSFSIKIMSDNDIPVCRKLIMKNTPIPAKEFETFNLNYAGQTSIYVDIYQGEETNPHLNSKIGRLVIDKLPPNLTVKDNIICEMCVDTDGVLTVSVKINKKECGRATLSLSSLPSSEEPNLLKDLEEFTNEF